ncbi:receptor-binding cancer antigen expressed on SiSo cells-like [Homarus americanus]|uniref:receptor-binding cancer antigen expressed on SiSo cells-like n=1 Tax=Homarus americanus TaxID=6706 RepID=UPI001C487C8E|nr:receptor-binding cancer antigen expressed on SiSo cells-like [Homarus americanus]XP_042205759.1 receptor-binding cancer antigen expressed on SiSo cells-like [Homarus americanus]XP_042205760.1 receptor-binding cancer antigen expressed on SiSo cells-like [Homarus americanus]
MIVMIAVRKVKSLLLLLLSLVRRCFCCIKRRRHSDSHLPIAVSVDGSTCDALPKQNDDGLGGWDSWDIPSSVVSDGGGRASLSPHMSLLQQQINQYRLNQQRKMQEPDPEPEPEPNYFEDLAPSIEKKPQVVILERPEEEQQVSNRLSFSLADPLLQSSELEEWMENDGGWEDEAEEADLDAVLREKRQFDRERRRQEQQRRKNEKEAARSSKLAVSKIATKLS